jgi:tagatose 1,6-diphosphate aldolase GatY/KbaY
MLSGGKGVLEEAYSNRWAIPGFVAYNLETVQGIVDAAEATGQAVLLQAGSSAFRHAGRRMLAALALEAAASANAAIGVHLDHSRSLEEVTACLDLGYTSVMIDGSGLGFADNVALTRAAVERAHAVGAWAEAELGAVTGDEDRSTNAPAGAMTRPDQAREFVRATQVDALAVAVGNVHGFTEVPPEIDLVRLEALRDATRIPLVLHGASGLADDVLVACMDRGVAKVNVNSELRRAFLLALQESLPSALAGSDLAAAMHAGRVAVAARAEKVIRSLARARGAEKGEP